MAWGAELIDAAAGRLAGLAGLGVVGAVVIATTFTWLYAQLLREGNHELVAVGVTLAAAWAASLHWLARPLLFTVLLAVVWHNELRRYESGGAARRVRIALPLLMLLWANLHAGFIFGFMLLGIYWCGATVDVLRGQGPAATRRWRTYTLAGLLCGAASLVNPQGIRLHLYVLAFVRSPYLRDWFTEYASANFQSATARPVLIWLALLFGTLVWCRQRWRFAEYAVVGLWTYAGLYAVRNVPLMAVLSAPILAGAWSAHGRASARVWAMPRGPAIGGRGSGALVALAAILLIGWRAKPIELPRAWLPVDAVART